MRRSNPLCVCGEGGGYSSGLKPKLSRSSMRSFNPGRVFYQPQAKLSRSSIRRTNLGEGGYSTGLKTKLSRSSMRRSSLGEGGILLASKPNFLGPP